VVGCAIFAAVSGSSAATCATIGKMSLPELKKRGYPDGISIGSLAGAGTLGLLIPPSIIMIVYGVTRRRVDRAAVHRRRAAGRAAGAAVLGLPDGLGAAPPAAGAAGRPQHELAGKLRESRHLIPVVLLIAGVLGSIYSGIATATEAAAVGVVGALIISRRAGLADLADLQGFACWAARGCTA
jgi:C4-dicarboxylate transporter DctM subunit